MIWRAGIMPAHLSNDPMSAAEPARRLSETRARQIDDGTRRYGIANTAARAAKGAADANGG